MLNFKNLSLTAICLLLCQCAASYSSRTGPPNMSGVTEEQRAHSIAHEPTGDFFYGRRYYVEKTRFWGYLREPRQAAHQAKLVIFLEDQKLSPDRLPEEGTSQQRYGFDQNTEYRIWGNYTGKTAYDPNTNQFLPVFRLRDYEVLDRQPGWLFRPSDHYDPQRFTLWAH